MAAGSAQAVAWGWFPHLRVTLDFDSVSLRSAAGLTLELPVMRPTDAETESSLVPEDLWCAQLRAPAWCLMFIKFRQISTLWLFLLLEPAPPPQLEYRVYKCGDPGRVGDSAQATNCKAKIGQQWPLVLKGEKLLK